jgi:glycosyltransferase involved in cell wall biosynthesis
MAEGFWRLGHKVLYIECGGEGRPFRRALGQGKPRGHNVVADLGRKGFFVMRASQVPVLSLSFPEFVRHWNSSRTSARATRFLSASDAARVTVCHYDWLFPDLFASARQTVRHVYECTEDHVNAPGTETWPLIRRHVRRTEKKLLGKADVTVFSSPDLARARADRARASGLLRMAVDTDHFARGTFPDPHLEHGIPERSADRPRIGFLGTVSERSDWAVVRAAAAETPGWQWVIVGPREHIHPRGPDNLHWLGPLRYDTLNAWLQHWDVGIVPYTPTTEYNQRSRPMKLLEYLAAALPVVSTDLPAARELHARLPDQVLVCPEHKSARFVETVRAALAVPAWKREAGRSFTRQYTWEDRARELLELADRHGARR